LFQAEQTARFETAFHFSRTELQMLNRLNA
jgi:hypothetical protein